MTIPSTTRKAGPFTGNSSTTSFPFTFKVFTTADVKVTVNDANGAETVLILDSGYSVTLNSDQESTPGGTVTYPISGSPLATGLKLTITGDISYAQGTDIPTGGDFNPTVLENALDSLSMQIQQIDEAVSRAAVVPVTSPADAAELSADIALLADNIAKLTTVYENIADVVTVADDLNEATSEINTVAVDIANVNAVGANISNVNAVAGNATNINAVSGNATNITAVAGNATNITAVAGNATNINAVNANSTNINTVASDLLEPVSEINTVAVDIANVNTTGANIASVNTVAGISSNVTTVAGISANVTTVAGINASVSNVSSISGAVTSVDSNATNINAVAGNATNINAVAGNAMNINAVNANATNINVVASDLLEPVSEINTVAVDIANVNTVGGDIANVNTVAGISGNIATVAGIAANVTSVAGNATNINAVAGNSTNINTVAGISTDVTTVSSNIVDIQNAEENATAAIAAKAAAEAARDAALAAFDSFDDRYLGQKASDPSLDNDGNALVTGALYFNTTSNIMKVWEGTSWVATYASLSGALIANNNLSDLTNTVSARSNLGLGTVATTASTDYATAAQGAKADTALQPANNLSDVASKTAAFDNVAPTTTKGDLIAHNGTDNVRVPVGTDTAILVADSSQPNGMKWEVPAAAGSFPSGTLMLFQQTAAPTGWVKQTTHDNKALRVVSGTAGTGGAVAFTTAFAAGSTGATTLTTAQMPSHSHSITSLGSQSSCGGSDGGLVALNNAYSIGTTATGGGGSHTHSLALNVSYVDLIIASKS